MLPSVEQEKNHKRDNGNGFEELIGNLFHPRANARKKGLIGTR